MKYVVLVRFTNDVYRDDYSRKFDSYGDALAFFRFLVQCDFEDLVTSFWCCSMSKGKKVLFNYSKF